MRQGVVIFVASLLTLCVSPSRAAGPVDFAQQIYPILKENCFECHGPDRQKSKLRLDTRQGIQRSIRDEILIPGNPEGSELIRRISLPKDDLDIMPPEDEGDPLSNRQIELVKEWVAEGARWTQPEGVPVPESRSGDEEQEGIDFNRDIAPILAGLSDTQRDLLVRWAQQGAPMPAAPSATIPKENQRVVSGLQVLYDFLSVEGEIIKDRSGVADLKIEEPNQVRRSQGALEIRGENILQTEKAPEKLIRAIQLSGAVTLEAWIRPANTDQSGPARILTLSQDSGSRNFTLGQDGNRFDVRFRTTETSGNGLPSVSTPPNRVKTELTHVVYTRDRSGNARIYLNGKLVQEQKVPGDVSNWSESYRLALGNEFSGGRLWKGTYSLVAVYNRHLLPREVEQNFRAGAEAATLLTEDATGTSKEKLFHTKIAPLFVQHCMECHDTATRKGGLDLSKRTAALAGGESGKVILPGNAEGSLLWKLVNKDEMPDERQALAAEDKEQLKRWIEEGAVWPVEEIDPLAYLREPNAGENWVQRLTVPEYIETVRSTFGVDIAEEARKLLPKDLRADGFNNTAYNLNVDFEHVEAYRQLAEIIVQQIDVQKFASEFVDCRQFTDDCMRELVAKMGKWILRGPLDEQEIAVLRGIGSTAASAGLGFEEAVGYIIQAMAQSPRFLYRMEHQQGDGTRWPVGPYELANRMSYILWGSSPDKELMRAADKGELYDPQAVKQQVERMLNDPRAVQRSQQFVSEWLNLGRLENLRPNPENFPHWDRELARDMRQETLAFFEEVAWEQKRPLADLFNAQVTFLTPQLAEHYGLDPQGEGWARYDLSSISARGGLLTQGSVLTIGGDEASTVTRGLFVLKDILRGRVNAPPPCVDTTPVETEPGLSKRAIAMDRINNPSCGGCHGKFEPLSFGMLKFDGLGTFQETDEHGNRLEDHGEILIPGMAEPMRYGSSAELMDLLARSDRVEETLTWKLAQFAVGRPLGSTDVPIVKEIHETAQENGGTYASLITAIVTSDLVQKIQTETEKHHE